MTFNGVNFNPVWITQGADKKMNDFADGAGADLAKSLTTSQIRNIYSEIKRIQSVGFENDKSSFYLLKPKVAYAYGRTVKKGDRGFFGNKGLKTFKDIFDEVVEHVTDEKTYNNFCNFMEAILAYHKYYGGRD